MLNKSQPELHEMLAEKSIDWNDLPARFKNGIFISKVVESSLTTYDDAIFTDNRLRIVMHLDRKD